MTTTAIPPTDDVARTLRLDETHRPRRWRRWIWPALALVVVALWLLARDRGAADSLRYETVAARRGDLVATVSATGTLEPVKKVDVGIEVSGTIKTVEVNYNDEITVGQVLARLDTAKLDAQVLQSEASLEAARAKLLQTQATVQETEAQLARLTRVREASGGKVPAQSDFDAQVAALARARADEASAKASIAQNQATLTANRTDLEKAVLRSSIKGVVLTRSVEPGQTVAAAFQSPTLFTLAEDLSQIELQVDVDEADVGQVKAGQEATFTVDAFPDRTFPARITQVRYGAQTVNGVVTYKTILQVNNAELILRPGMTATAVITVRKTTDALLVPAAALRFTPPAAAAAPNPGKGGGSLMSSLLPRPPGSTPRPVAESGESKATEQTVWTLRDGQLAALTVTKGMSDGTWTEAVGDVIGAGTPLVIGLAASRP